MQKNINIMYFTALLQGMVFYAPIATLYRTSIGVTISQIAAIESVSLVLSFVFELPWGVLADRIGYKKTIVICNLLYFISKLVFWRATGIFCFFAERIILACVISGLSGVDVSVLYLSCPPENRTKVFGIYNALGTLGLITASFIYTIFIGNNYRLAGALTALSYCAAALVSLGLREVKHHTVSAYSVKNICISLKNVISNIRLILFLISIALITQTFQSITVFFSQLKYESLGASHHIIGISHIVLTFAGLTSVFSAAVTRNRKVVDILAVIAALAAALCLLLSKSTALITAILSVIALQCLFSLFEPLQLLLQNQITISEDRATALSINTAVTDSVSAVASVVLGYAAEKNLSLAFVLCSILCITSAILIKAFKGSTD